MNEIARREALEILERFDCIADGLKIDNDSYGDELAEGVAKLRALLDAF